MCAVFVSSNWTTGMLPTESGRHGHVIRAWGDGTHGGMGNGTRYGTERKSYIRIMEKMRINSDSIDFLI